VFLSTHILQEVEAVCESHVIIMHEGRLVAQGDIHSVRADLQGDRRRYSLTSCPARGARWTSTPRCARSAPRSTG
jgi:ABC-type multidrug transport system ATPase subunit